MAQSWDIDPQTKDYVMQNGNPIETDSLRIPAYFRLMIPRGKYIYGENQIGSEFYALRKKRSQFDTDICESLAERALEPMAEDGRAREILIEANTNVRQGIGLSIKIIGEAGTADQLDLPSLGV